MYGCYYFPFLHAAYFRSPLKEEGRSSTVKDIVESAVSASLKTVKKFALIVAKAGN